VPGTHQSFVALQANEFGVERTRQGLGDFGFADTGFAFNEQGPPQLHRE
jgi:hypothetical protein